MLTLEKGTKCIKILLLQASKDTHTPIFGVFSYTLRKNSDAKLQHPDLI
jgi:hypothetical protein